MSFLQAAGYGLIFTFLFVVVVGLLLGLSRLFIDWLFETFPNIPMALPYVLTMGLLMFLGTTLILYVEGKA